MWGLPVLSYENFAWYVLTFPNIGKSLSNIFVAGSPFTGIADVHLANINPLHQSNLAAAKVWMDIRNSEHSKRTCTKQEEVTRPTRLIDMMTLPSSGDLSSAAGDEAV
jgi:hypothetical protein